MKTIYSSAVPSTKVQKENQNANTYNHNVEVLVYKGANGQVLTNSLMVAEKFKKEHKNILRDIETLKKDMLNFELMFEESDYEDIYGRLQKMYVMNIDGFMLLAMERTGRRKLDYIDAFNKMESMIKSDNYNIARSQEQLQKKIAAGFSSNNNTNLLTQKLFA